jgi:capsular exopolysaccharide synthesis family protein
VRPKTKLNIILSFIFGLILGVGVVFLREYLDDTIKSQEDIEEIFNLPLLGYIPLMNKHNSLQKKKKGNGSKEKSTLASEKELFLYYYPKSQVAECFRAIRTNLLFMSPDAPFKKILITSACPEEGKTTIAVNLAIAMAQSGLRVLLLDTDMRRSRLHKIFPTKGSPGLTRLILGKTTIPEALLSSDIPNLFVIPSGLIPPNPAELLQTERFKEVLKELSFQFDRIILDSPPALIVTDSVILGTLIDGCIFVVKSAKTTKGALKQMKRSFLDVGVNIIGCLLNETREGKKGYKYPSYYFKKYGYYYEESETPEEKNRENS